MNTCRDKTDNKDQNETKAKTKRSQDQDKTQQFEQHARQRQIEMRPRQYKNVSESRLLTKNPDISIIVFW